jgi:hypothetical protein
MNRIERGRRVEREIELIGTETVAQGMIESKIETEVKGTGKPIGAMLVGGDEYEQTFFLCFACYNYHDQSFLTVMPLCSEAFLLTVGHIYPTVEMG